jgi:hypothetical protein
MIPTQGLASDVSETGQQFEKRATFNGYGTITATVFKDRDPWGGTPEAAEYKFDLARSCDPDSVTCVTIESIPPGHTYESVRGQLTAIVVNAPRPFADPNNCANHNGASSACGGVSGCTYRPCNDACVPTGTVPCDAGCLGACGLTIVIDDATLVDREDEACSSWAVHLNI